MISIYLKGNYLRIRETETEGDRGRGIFHPQMPAAAKAGLRANQKAEAAFGLPCWLLRCIIKKPDWEWRSWDLNQCPEIGFGIACSELTS